MKTAAAVFPLALSLACTNLYTEAHNVSARNQLAIGDLALGTPRAEVLARLRSGELRVREGRTSASFLLDNPHHSTSVELRNGEPADVLYYYTGPMADDGIATADELTPVVLSAGGFAGAGWDFLEAEALPESLAEAKREEMEREIREARRLETRRPGWDPLEQSFREELGRASNLIRMITLPGL